MIQYLKENHNILIKGQNKMDAAWLAWAILLLGIVTFLISINLENGYLTEGIVIVSGILLGLLIKYTIKFEIHLSKNQLLIKKTFLQIPYVKILWPFDRIQKLDSTRILFHQEQAKLEIEDHEGFKVDCLLIVKDKVQYEIGDEEDSKLIFTYLEDGIDSLGLN